jgi:hypothetical protein
MTRSRREHQRQAPTMDGRWRLGWGVPPTNLLMPSMWTGSREAAGRAKVNRGLGSDVVEDCEAATLHSSAGAESAQPITWERKP